MKYHIFYKKGKNRITLELYKLQKTFHESSLFQGLLMKTAPWTVRIPSKCLDVTAFLNSSYTAKKKEKVARKNNIRIESVTVETCFAFAKGFGFFW